MPIFAVLKSETSPPDVTWIDSSFVVPEAVFGKELSVLDTAGEKVSPVDTPLMVAIGLLAGEGETPSSDPNIFVPELPSASPSKFTASSDGAHSDSPVLEL
mmetsp:Transcript_3/g.10  ORF Transcript_3/g.10 Transcript_3/m.10 type:complete len:101 (+) Transcript_3:1526-1828(+)